MPGAPEIFRFEESKYDFRMAVRNPSVGVLDWGLPSLPTYLGGVFVTYDGRPRLSRRC